MHGMTKVYTEAALERALEDLYQQWAGWGSGPDGFIRDSRRGARGTLGLPQPEAFLEPRPSASHFCENVTDWTSPWNTSSSSPNGKTCFATGIGKWLASD